MGSNSVVNTLPSIDTGVSCGTMAKGCSSVLSLSKSSERSLIRNCILFGYTGEASGVDAVGQITEEIVAEDVGDAPEQVDVDILFPEYLVNIGACAA